jgi:hypothetical protein
MPASHEQPGPSREGDSPGKGRHLGDAGQGRAVLATADCQVELNKIIADTWAVAQGSQVPPPLPLHAQG